MATRRVKWTFSGAEGVPTPGDADHPTPRQLSEDDIGVVFQPILEANSGREFAHEALVRCRWPKFQNPHDLLSAASAEGSCGRLGRLIRQVASNRAPKSRLFVNIHPDELSSRWLVRPDDPLCFHDGELFLEVTESTAFTHFDLCMSVLKEVCARTGAHLVVDDLGAGYSNLKRVLDLEPKIVKLDRELVAGIEKSKRQQMMVAHVVKLCTELGSLVVAEGIESAGELAAAQAAGVHFVQGYLFAKPAFPAPEARWNPHWKRRGRATTQIRKSFPPDQAVIGRVRTSSRKTSRPKKTR